MRKAAQVSTDPLLMASGALIFAMLRLGAQKGLWDSAELEAEIVAAASLQTDTPLGVATSEMLALYAVMFRSFDAIAAPAGPKAAGLIGPTVGAVCVALSRILEEHGLATREQFADHLVKDADFGNSQNSALVRFIVEHTADALRARGRPAPALDLHHQSDEGMAP
jgi:hypothetical protein